MKIISVQNAIPVYVTLEDHVGRATVLAMVDYVNRAVDIPEPEDRRRLQDEKQFASLLFDYYDSLNTFQVDVPQEVYAQYERSYKAAEAKKTSIKEMSNEL